ncbi:MAG TPA: hypothetical protein VFJ65_01120 [Solirubrobacterales bacterium]|nr:hypothetical protein [Solirubrobacterales bacterium]
MLGAAVLAFAATAPAASAWNFHRQDKTATTRFLPDGKNRIKLTVALNAMECQETGEGTTEGTELSEETETVTSEECNIGEAQVKVVQNGCKEKYVKGLVNFIGTTSIFNCQAGKKIEYQAPGCTVTIGEQTGLSSVTFKNIANGGLESEKEVTAELSIANLKYEEDNVAPGNSCVHNGMMQENGALNGPELITDEKGGVMKGFWVA